MQVTSKIILFTLAACPIGRNMGTVLHEVGQENPSIEIKVIYVEIDEETTNHYKVKTNPTLIFLNRKDKELYRLEGFHETTEINQIMHEMNENRSITTNVMEPNKETIEDYTIFLLQDGKPTAVKIKHRNKTSVKAPRITAINRLLVADINGYENPFPTDSKLHSIEFDHSLAKITIQTEVQTSTIDINQLETILLKTLEPFGIEKINLTFLM